MAKRDAPAHGRRGGPKQPNAPQEVAAPDVIVDVVDAVNAVNPDNAVDAEGMSA
jgi:hypothetical protein